jgi:1,4-dihydroxy-2-naphthoyl-CoA synthase
VAACLRVALRTLRRAACRNIEGVEHTIEVNAEGLALIRKDNVREFSLRAGANWTITFNRPKRRNCLTREVLLELEELLLRVGDDDDARVLILTGSGSAFSAGADISGGKNLEDSTERMKSFARDIKGFPRLNARVLETLMRLDALTIAAVNGFAVGGLPVRRILSLRLRPLSFGYLKSRWGYLFSDYRLKSSPEGLVNGWPRSS